MGDQHTIEKKIDMYMKYYVIPLFSPNELYWWFSLSGGKDSFCMCLGVYLWYKRNGYSFQGTAFLIKQWDNGVLEALRKQINWIDIICIDAFAETQSVLNYRDGDQAPCKLCSTVRKSSGDRELFPLMDPDKVNLIARGLHLSDTAISYLWRWAFYDCIEDSLIKSKYLPLVQIKEGVFLAKPLAFTREFETEEFSKIHGFISSCCMCPACRYPSRRDIVEESMLYLLKVKGDSFWEFSVPGVSGYLRNFAPSSRGSLMGISTGGFASKCNHIPDSFYSYAISFFMEKSGTVNFDKYNANLYLDDFGKNSVLTQTKLEFDGKMPIPKFFCPDATLSEYERRMISTLGPFWGFIGLKEEQRKRVLDFQTEIFGFTPDKAWGQVNYLLNLFYKGRTM